MLFSKKHFILGIFIGVILLFSAAFSLPDGRLHITFCDVGQGDAAYIRAPNNQDMLIDGGPDDKVLTCLGRNMPFYDRTLDVVVLSHPQKDHLQGLISVVERYNIKYFVIGAEGNETEGYRKLIKNIEKKNIPVKVLYAGDKFSLGNVQFDVLWPEKEWVAQHLSSSISDLSYLGNLRVLGIQTDTDTNNFSYYINLKYGFFSALFTGDGDSRIQPKIMDLIDLPDVDVLKFPHHGSKYGVTAEFLAEVVPELAVISSGKNPWGHPTKEALDLLEKMAIKFKRTDLEGDIEITSDGRNWAIN